MRRRTVEADETYVHAAHGRVATVDPLLAARAAAFAHHALTARRSASPGAAAWAGSALTPPGYPLALEVASADPGLGCVAEVLAPEEDPREALGRAIVVAGDLGARRPGPALVATLADVQAAGPLGFGAWLGARHRATGSPLALHVEVPGQADEALWDVLGALAPGAERILGGAGLPRLLRVALDGSATVEVVCRAPRLGADDLASLCARADLLARRGRALAAALDEHGGSPLGGPAAGVSVTVAPGGVAHGVTVFSWAPSPEPDDAAIRAAVLRRARAEAWPSRAIYERLSAPLAVADASDGRWHRPPVCAVGAGERVERRVSLAPPPPPARRHAA